MMRLSHVRSLHFHSSLRIFISNRSCSSSDRSRLRAKYRFIPSEPVTRFPDRGNVKISSETIDLLERLSLVDFASKEGLRRVEDTVAHCEIIRTVDTTGVEPLISILENESLRLREDVVAEQSKSRILSTAELTEDGYFVAPPGNIPLERDTECYDEGRAVTEGDSFKEEQIIQVTLPNPNEPTLEMKLREKAEWSYGSPSAKKKPET